MAIGYVLAALISAAIAIFALQNSAQTSVRFLAWGIDTVPVAAVALSALAAGLVLVGLPLAVRAHRWRSRARSLEARVQALETALADRERALLRGPSPPQRPDPM
jgi:uncharacterized integral membrane protein